MRPRLIAIVLALSAVAGSASAANPPAAGSAPAAPAAAADGVPVMPPRAIAELAAPYPADGRGDALVVLDVVVGPDGAVTSAVAAQGLEPFAGAAERAAAAWRFDAAMRNGARIASRIRVEVRFHAPPPVPAPPPGPAPPPPGPAPAPSTPKRGGLVVDDVVVLGARSPPMVTSLERAEVRQLPGAFGDPLRAIEALPGVTPIVSGLPYFYVRGAPPGNVGYYLDGVRLPYLFHVALGPSVIHPGLIQRVDLHPGGYPAQYGRFAGAIVSASTVAPSPTTRAEGNLRLFDVGALAETGFAGGRGTALVGARYSYTAAILSLIAKDTTLDYRDYQARASYDLGPKDRVSIFAIGAYDLLKQTTDGLEEIVFGAEFYRLDTRYDHTFAPGHTVRAAITLGWDQAKVPGQPRLSRDTLVGARVETAHVLAPFLALRGGADVMVDFLRAGSRPFADPNDPETARFNTLFPPRDDVATGAWTDLRLNAGPIEVIPGVRADIFHSGGITAVGVDPRVASRIKLHDRVHVIHAFGMAHQPPAFTIPVPGAAIGRLRGGLQESIQSSAGVEVALPDSMTATLSVFHNIFRNMTDTLGLSPSPPDLDGDFNEQRSLGAAHGLEGHIKRKLTRRLGGYASYTLSRSTRSAGRDKFLSAFDRTHVGSLAAVYEIGRNWRAGARFVFYTGTPGRIATNPPVRSAERDREPGFYRIDLRLEKRWLFGERAFISFVAEMMNATFHREVVFGTTVGPVTIPSVGVEGAL